MEKPRIQLSGSNEDRSAYDHAVIQAGGVPVSGYCPTVDPSCAGLILCGGDDMDPARFGQENRGSVDIDPRRDQAELDLTAAYLAAGKPIFGICRGHQVVNVALGGTLIQDLRPELHIIHSHEPGATYNKVHPIRTAEGSILRRFYGPLMAVNSAHHQALDLLGAGLVPTAWSESGLVEAMEHESRPILCVQFHPEQMSHNHRRPDAADGSFLFSAFSAFLTERLSKSFDLGGR